MGVQWKGLPYGECTWENFQDIFKAEGQHCVDQYQVPFSPFNEDRGDHHPAACGYCHFATKSTSHLLSLLSKGVIISPVTWLLSVFRGPGLKAKPH